MADAVTATEGMHSRVPQHEEMIATLVTAVRRLADRVDALAPAGRTTKKAKKSKRKKGLAT